MDWWNWIHYNAMAEKWTKEKYDRIIDFQFISLHNSNKWKPIFRCSLFNFLCCTSTRLHHSNYIFQFYHKFNNAFSIFVKPNENEIHLIECALRSNLFILGFFIWTFFTNQFHDASSSHYNVLLHNSCSFINGDDNFLNSFSILKCPVFLRNISWWMWHIGCV